MSALSANLTLEQPRVLVVEPDEQVRSHIAEALVAAGYVVRPEADGTGIAKAVREFQPDLAVLDAYFEVPPCGYTMTRTLRRSTDLPALLILRREDAIHMRLFGLEAGADQLILKPFSASELVARVRALLRRRGHASSSTIKLGNLLLHEPSRTATRDGIPLDLTQREFELLLAFARNPGRVLSKQRLAMIAWGSDAWGLSTLATQVGTLRRKLEAHGPRLIHTAHGVGYVLKT